MSATHEPLLASLSAEVISRAREARYLSPEELPFLPELEAHGRAIVTGVCTAISGRMEAGMPHEELARVFDDVIRRTFDLVYRWYRSEDGAVAVPEVTGEPGAEEFSGELPEGLLAALREIPAGAVLYDAFASWLDRNIERVRAEGMDLWVPLGTALQMTFMVATAMALTTFEAE